MKINDPRQVFAIKKQSIDGSTKLDFFPQKGASPSVHLKCQSTEPDVTCPCGIQSWLYQCLFDSKKLSLYICLLFQLIEIFLMKIVWFLRWAIYLAYVNLKLPDILLRPDQIYPLVKSWPLNIISDDPNIMYRIWRMLVLHCCSSILKPMLPIWQIFLYFFFAGKIFLYFEERKYSRSLL